VFPLTFRRWLPDLCYKNVFDIPWQRLRADGTRAVLFDLDNTLGVWGTGQLDDEVLALLRRLQGAGLVLGVLSNSRLRGRQPALQAQLEPLSIPLVGSANKPAASGYVRVLEQLDARATESVMVGDQWMTDVLGAKRLGMGAIWVEPFKWDSQPWWSKMRQHAERWTLRRCGPKATF